MHVSVSLVARATAFSALMVLTAAHADTTTIDFTDNVGHFETSFARPVDGGTATFFNPITVIGPDQFVSTNNNGLQIGGANRAQAFDFMFDVDVMLIGYITRDFVNEPLFDITGPGVASIGNTSVGGAHTFVGGPLKLTAGNVYHFETQTFSAAEASFLQGLTLDVVPEPASIGLLVAGLPLLRRR